MNWSRLCNASAQGPALASDRKDLLEGHPCLRIHGPQVGRRFSIQLPVHWVMIWPTNALDWIRQEIKRRGRADGAQSPEIELGRLKLRGSDL